MLIYQNIPPFLLIVSPTPFVQSVDEYVRTYVRAFGQSRCKQSKKGWPYSMSMRLCLTRAWEPRYYFYIYRKGRYWTAVVLKHFQALTSFSRKAQWVIFHLLHELQKCQPHWKCSLGPPKHFYTGRLKSSQISHGRFFQRHMLRDYTEIIYRGCLQCSSESFSSRRFWGHERRLEVTRASVNILRMCLRPWGQVADARMLLLKFKIEREILVLESSRLGKIYLVISDIVVKLLA